MSVTWVSASRPSFWNVDRDGDVRGGGEIFVRRLRVGNDAINNGGSDDNNNCNNGANNDDCSNGNGNSRTGDGRRSVRIQKSGGGGGVVRAPAQYITRPAAVAATIKGETRLGLLGPVQRQ